MNEQKQAPDASAISAELLELLRCPLTHKPVVLVDNELRCYESRKGYPIEDGIPVMLVEEARDLSENEIPESFRGQTPLTAPE
ncbi:MAG: Trm112 family protein [Planctomycetota bacterium]